MKNEVFEKVVSGIHLSLNESFEAMSAVMSGEVNNARLAGFLIALKAKGETAEEIAGFALAMREKSIKLTSDPENAIDVCGTGGDGSSTFNISTAAAFVVAGAGITVAKHGNRAISSKCGSADVLHELGININLSPEDAQRSLDVNGIAFLFAPNYHPAMKFAAPVRKELAVRTVFNMLGPLTNPAGVKRQLTGTFSTTVSKKMSEAAQYLSYTKVCFVTSGEGIDEISLTDATAVYEYDKGASVSGYHIDSASFGYDKIDKEELAGTTAQYNARVMFDILDNRGSESAFRVVAANAAMALYAGGYSDVLSDCTAAAEESIHSGRALDKLKLLQNFK